MNPLWYRVIVTALILCAVLVHLGRAVYRDWKNGG